MAVQDLKSYTYMCASTENLPQKIKLLRCELGVGGGIKYDRPCVQKTPDHDRRVVAGVYDIEQLETLLHSNRLHIKLIKAALDSLCDMDRRLLVDFYVTRIHYDTLSLTLSMDRSSIYRKVKVALDRYILSYYGVGKSD